MLPFRNLKRFIAKSLRQPAYALRVALKRAYAYYHYSRGTGQSSPPEAVTFFLTRLCNLHCKMCGQWGDYGITKQEDAENLKLFLSKEEVDVVLNDIVDFKPNVTLFGGEPFLHPNFLEIVRSVKKKGLHCLVITNGTLLKRFAQEIVEAGLDELNISIDGGSALHDEIRGIPGIFEQIMSGIDEVNAFKTQMSKSKPLINIQCTISRFNHERLHELVFVAERARANALTFHNLIFLKKDLLDEQKAFDQELGCSSRDWEGFIFESGVDPKKLFQAMQEIMKAKHDFSVDFYPNFSEKGVEEYYKNPDYLPSEYAPRCVSPWICAYIFPDGSVRPCLNCSYSFGNVKKTEFMNVWNSFEALRYRKTLKKEGIFPVCRRCTELYRY